MGKNSLVPALQELWNVWEIHCLILVSLSLQVFLFLFADLRRRSVNPVLHTVLWLAYLSADSVAIFVLGHLAVRASEPGHQLISFWAPFVLVHLGGQNTITALSRQDNELWKRHLLSLVTQVAGAVYVVATSSWPNGWLRAAMALMFLSGCFKYAERTLCLYLASPERLRSRVLCGLSDMLKDLEELVFANPGPWSRKLFVARTEASRNEARANKMKKGLDNILEGSSSVLVFDESIRDILAVDAPLNSAASVSYAEGNLPSMLERFQSSSGRCMVYGNVGEVLADFYLELYTKHRESSVSDSCSFIKQWDCHEEPCETIGFCAARFGPLLLYDLFQYVSTPIALVLFWAAEKGGQDQLHSSKADIIVSYILLIGAIVLDVSSAIMSIFSKYIQLPAAWWSKRQWSEELAQYNMIKRHVVQDTIGMASIYLWIAKKCLGDWGIELLELTHTPITEDHTPIKEFILDNLLGFGARKKWNIASSRGRLALQDWMDKHGGPNCERPTRKALVETTGSDIDFPKNVLIWHIATDICYYFGYNASSTNSEQMKKHRQMSRELSNYIMYLVFKSGVMLTTYSQHLHENTHDQIKKSLSGHEGQQVTLDEKAAVMKLFQAKKKEEQQDQYAIVDIEKHEEPANNNDHDNGADIIQKKLLQLIEGLDSPVREAVMKHYFQVKKKEEQQAQSTVATKKHQQPAHNNDNDADNHLQKLKQSKVALDTPVLPHACEVAQELISITDEIERWVLIASVWAEMLYYAAPRCGAAFHYEHLSTGGEFVTHVLVLMKLFGPFLPPSRA